MWDTGLFFVVGDVQVHATATTKFQWLPHRCMGQISHPGNGSPAAGEQGLGGPLLGAPSCPRQRSLSLWIFANPFLQEAHLALPSWVNALVCLQPTLSTSLT